LQIGNPLMSPRTSEANYRTQPALGDALAHQRDKWEPETTARNLTLAEQTRQRRGEDVRWLEGGIQQLKGASDTEGMPM
jgi:hypothetical protein